MNNFIKYFLIGALLVTLVDYTTAFNPNYLRWISYLPDVLIFYVGYSLLFALLIYKLGLKSKRLFIAMLIAGFCFEILLFKNKLYFTYPMMLITIPATVFIYGFVTYAPKWIAEKSVSENKKKLILLTAAWIIISFLAFSSNSGSG